MQDNTFIDPRDGQVYKIVKIGEQIWFADNFRYKCKDSFAYDDDESYVEKYGRLYTWEAAVNNAPPGWHLPTMDEWHKLNAFVEDADKEKGAGTILKSITDWKIYRDIPQGCNEFAFAALPTGIRNLDGGFNGLGYSAYFWTATIREKNSPFSKVLLNSSVIFKNDLLHPNFALSVRFVRDR
ncbi:MAG: hypothetical protein MJZ22_02890 [Candidatus Saccharibacteria bacterium]|nr:hypothetical protein [Candidatus Saccharibacteria bacterium]